MLNVNDILNRTIIENDIIDKLNNFTNNLDSIQNKKGFYVYGSPGTGKSTFVINILKKLNYDIIKYDAGDVRNKALIDTITNNNISNKNVLDLMNQHTKKKVIIMDEIDGMNNGDKGGLSALIRLIRHKKTKKQKLEDKTSIPIFCIGNYTIDKKIKELMKVCNTYDLLKPTKEQTLIILKNLLPDYEINYNDINNYIEGDLRKLDLLTNIVKKNNNYIKNDRLIELFCKKSFNEDAKKISGILINKPYSLSEHNKILNETDRTIVALLWHENIIDMFKDQDKKKVIKIYSKILNNICFADYIDRITFQNQIWQFNEMSSLIKTFYVNKIYHDYFPENLNKFNVTDEIRFTKVLTKYSTEYNNMMFIYNLSQELELDKKDLFSMFQELRIVYKDIDNVDILTKLEIFFQEYNVTKLDIKRIYRFLDKNLKKDVEIVEE
jgi:replication factor C subunit 1|tara:strand:- start:867 stop:2180 length:1314 start_codon:yes stop_codon:yes gene_type:complete